MAVGERAGFRGASSRGSGEMRASSEIVVVSFIRAISSMLDNGISCELWRKPFSEQARSPTVLMLIGISNEAAYDFISHFLIANLLELLRFELHS